MAENNEVVYTLSLKDMLSGKLRESAEEAHHLDGNLEHASHRLEKLATIAEAFGVSFSLYRGIEFVKESIEVAEKLHQSEAQLKNTMENMGTYSEEAFEKVVEKSKELSRNVNFNQEDFMQLNAQLRLVGNVGEKEFGRMSTDAANIAAKFGGGLTEAGELLAKAINTPELARRLAMKIKIDPTVLEHLKALSDGGHEAAARLKLLEIVEHQVGGAAEAAFNADPMAKFKKAIHDMKQDMGSLVVQILHWVAPALQSMVDHTRAAVHWIKEHKEGLKFLGVVVGFAAGAFLVLKLEAKAAAIIMAVTDTVVAATAMGTYLLAGGATTASVATRFLTGAQQMLNNAMTANPIGIVIVALSALVTAIIYAYYHFEKFRGVIFAIGYTFREFGRIIGEVMHEVGGAIYDGLHFNVKGVADHLDKLVEIHRTAGMRMAQATKDGYKAGIDDFNAAATKKSEVAAPKGGKKFDSSFGMKDAKDEAKGSKGSKNTTINVKIGSLISGGFKIETRNIHDGAGKVKELVTQAMLDVMNNSQMIAGS